MIREEAFRANPLARRLTGSGSGGWWRGAAPGALWALAGTSIPVWVAAGEVLNNRSTAPDGWLLIVLALSAAGVLAGPTIAAVQAGSFVAADGQRNAGSLLWLTPLAGRQVMNGYVGAVAVRLRLVWGLMAGSLLPLYGVGVVWLARIYSRVACRWIVVGACLPLERTLPRAAERGATLALALGVLFAGLAWLGLCSGTALGLRFSRTRWAGLLGAGLVIGLVAALTAWMILTREARLSWLARAWRQPLAAGLVAFALGEMACWLGAHWWDHR